MEIEQAEDGTILSVIGNSCNRGDSYARKELTTPMRMLTTTVAIEGALHRRLPVILTGEIPKEKQEEVMKEISKICVKAPIFYQQILKQDICGLGVAVMASRSMDPYENE
jgi:CxxC motif-containing protein